MLKPFFFLPLEMMKHRNSRRFRSTSHQNVNLSTNRNDKLIFFLCFLLFSERKSRLVHTMTSSAWVEMAKRNSMLRRRRRRPPRLLPLLYSGDNEELKTLSLENDSFSPFSSSSFLCTLIKEEIRRPLIHWMFLK